MPMSHEQAVKAGKKTAEIRWGKRRRRSMQPVVGFYKDMQGRTRPITKSSSELNRKKIVERPRQFKKVPPHQQETNRNAQLLEDQIGKLTEAQNALAELNQQRSEATHELAITEIDGARTQQQKRIEDLQRKIRMLSM